MNTRQAPIITAALLLLFGLIAASAGAVSGAVSALHTCASVIVPCLFPFFVVSFLINRSGLSQWLGKLLEKPMSLLFGVSGTGAGVFLLGILGGYPAGAGIIADLMHRGELHKSEAQRLIMFCNNSGPAFLIGAVGIGIFHSTSAGLLLYGIHVLSAIITGLFLAGSHPPKAPSAIVMEVLSLSEALPEAISKAVTQTLQVCGYVVFFGAVTGALEQTGTLPPIYSSLAANTPLTLHDARALCMGIMELGCGIGAMQGTSLCPRSLTLCAFLTGFGGLSVCLQTMGMLQGTNIGVRYHLAGRLCCGCLSGFLMYVISSIML